MKTKTINIYEHSELSKGAFKKAYQKWSNAYDLPFMQSMMNDECGQLLKEHNITCTSNHPVCLYSLSSCQGDGVMFQGSFLWNDYSIKIKHSGHYYHSNSKNIEMIKIVDGQEIEANELDYQEFENIYQSICKKLEKWGYDLIEDELSESHFIDLCNENEWMFTKDGIISKE